MYKYFQKYLNYARANVATGKLNFAEQKTELLVYANNYISPR